MTADMWRGAQTCIEVLIIINRHAGVDDILRDLVELLLLEVALQAGPFRGTSQAGSQVQSEVGEGAVGDAEILVDCGSSDANDGVGIPHA